VTCDHVEVAAGSAVATWRQRGSGCAALVQDAPALHAHRAWQCPERAKSPRLAPFFAGMISASPAHHSQLERPRTPRMIELAVAREVATPAPPHSRHFAAPAWWPEWISQALAASAPARPTRATAASRAAVPAPEAAYPAAVAALRTALRDARETSADAGADDWAITVAAHQVHLARRAVRALLESAAATGPGSRLEWCQCGESAAAG
jgi:hypothetical protein